MKKVWTIWLTMLALVLNAQEGFRYKALIADNGTPLSNQNVTVEFSIYDPGNNLVYQETQNTTTDAYGIMSAVVGEGSAVSGDFATIDWVNGPYSLQVRISTDGGSTYNDFGTQEMKWVPYAKYAQTADYNNLTNKPQVFKTYTTNDPAMTDMEHIFRSGPVTIGFRTNYGLGYSTFRVTRDDANNTGYSTGIYVYSAANGDGLGSGVMTRVGGYGNGEHTGYDAMVVGNGNGKQYGFKSLITNSGGGNHYGMQNVLSTSGDGSQIGVMDSIIGTGNGRFYGMYNYLAGNGNTAVYNKIVNDGSGIYFGIYNELSGSGSTYFHWGILNNIKYTGSYAALFGTENYFDTPTDATLYGTYNAFSSSTTGTGDKYGTYNEINENVGGNHYAVYGKALGTPPSGNEFYAGYFDGDIKVTRRLKGEDSGDADMKAYVYGLIRANGTIYITGSSEGFTITKVGTGQYEIFFDDTNLQYGQYLVVASLRYGNIGFITTNLYDGHFYIDTYDTSGTAADKDFSFVVYRK